MSASSQKQASSGSFPLVILHDCARRRVSAHDLRDVTHGAQ